MASGTLFAQDFLLTGIAETRDWLDLGEGEVDAIAEALRARLSDGAKSLKEGNTEGLVLFPILDALGWNDRRLVQEKLDNVRRLRVPDAILFLTPEARREAQHKTLSAERYGNAAILVEGKAWERSLDRASGSEATPSAQLQNYLARAYFGSDRRLRFGILTNGRNWRLYDFEAKSLATDFFEVDLAELLAIGSVAMPLFAATAQERRR